MNIKLPYYAAIDPLAIILPDTVYVKLIEFLHPHVPLVEALQKVNKGLTAAERKAVLARVNTMAEWVNCVKEIVEPPVG